MLLVLKKSVVWLQAVQIVVVYFERVQARRINRVYIDIAMPFPKCFHRNAFVVQLVARDKSFSMLRAKIVSSSCQDRRIVALRSSIKRSRLLNIDGGEKVYGSALAYRQDTVCPIGWITCSVKAKLCVQIVS